MYKGSFVVAVGIPWLLVAEVCKLFSPLFTHSFISFSAIFIKSLQKELIMHIQPSRVLSQLFPINVKGSAGSICNFISGITGWAVAYYFNLLTKWSSAGAWVPSLSTDYLIFLKLFNLRQWLFLGHSFRNILYIFSLLLCKFHPSSNNGAGD